MIATEIYITGILNRILSMSAVFSDRDIRSYIENQDVDVVKSAVRKHGGVWQLWQGCEECTNVKINPVSNIVQLTVTSALFEGRIYDWSEGGWALTIHFHYSPNL